MENTKHDIGRNSSFKMLNLGQYLNSWLNKYRLGTQLNISFALVMLVPMIIATLFSIIYYSNKIEEEAVNKISSDANMAKLIYQHAQGEMGSLADAYSKKSALRVLTNLILAKEKFDENMARKLGNNLANLAPLDNLDMITMVNIDRRVFTRSHSPDRIGDICKPKSYFKKVFKGETINGVESLTVKEVKSELQGEEGSKRLKKLQKYFLESQNILALTGIAPVYDKRNRLKGALIARRLLTPQSSIVSEACKLLNTSAALFEHDHLVTSCMTDAEDSEFVKPPQKMLNAVLQSNTEQHIADISRGGSISKFFPLENFDGAPVGVFMVQASVNSYLRTRNIAIITSLCIFLIGVLLAYSVKKIIERRIVEPLNELKIGTELVASGEYSHTLDVSSDDEIGELTQAFNNMTNDLENYDKQVKANKAQLEIKVKERTADLTKALDNLVKSNTMLEDTMETLNPGVSKLIEGNQQELGLVYATELVVDICTYTTLNMTLGEDMMGGFMKTFFRESHKLLAKYRGVFDKTVGDQIVAIFGISKDNIQANPHHAFDAVECARKLVEVAKQINKTMHATVQENYTAMTERHKSLSSEDRKKIKLDELKFRCRVGINTSNPNSDREIDKMRMVMMGAETCVDYTAQGGSIIYAFRLESGGTPGEIGIGENTKRLVENVYELKELGKVTLKGLGEQNEYRVIGRQPITDNIYPKTLFYQKFHENTPSILTMLIEKIKMGAIQLNEVRKLSESLDVDITYLEHITGIHNLVGARALFAYAVGQLHGMNEDRVNAILLASLLRNSAMLRNIAAEFLNFMSVDVHVPPNILDTKLAKKITDDLNQPRPIMTEAKIINMCNYFDHNAFDRTNLRQREAEVASTKIVIEAMLDDRRFNSKLVKLLKTLIIAEEGYLEDGSISADHHIPSYKFTADPLALADEIKERFSEEATDALIAALSVRQTSEMAQFNGEETIDITEFPVQTDTHPDIMPDTVDLDARALEEDTIETPEIDQEEADLLDTILDKKALIDTSLLNENDNAAIEETVSFDDEQTDTLYADGEQRESSETLPLNEDDAAIEETVSFDDEQTDTLDADNEQRESSEALPLNEDDAAIEETVSFDDEQTDTLDADNEQRESSEALPLNEDDTAIEETVSFDDEETAEIDFSEIEMSNALPLNEDDDTIEEVFSYDDAETDATETELDRIELSDTVFASENDLFDAPDAADQSDTDALYEELRKMKSSDMLQIEDDNESEGSHINDK